MHRPTQYRALRRYAALLLGSLTIHLGIAALAEAEEPTHDYAVAAQPLNGALTDFADQSDLKLMFPAELARGIASPGVTGALTPVQALARLLAGTGITYRYTSPDTLTLERSDPLNDLVKKAKQPLRVAEEEKKKFPPHRRQCLVGAVHRAGRQSESRSHAVDVALALEVVLGDVRTVPSVHVRNRLCGVVRDRPHPLAAERAFR